MGNLRHIISNIDYKFPGFFANLVSPFKMSSRIVEDENVYFHQEFFKIFIQFNFDHREKNVIIPLFVMSNIAYFDFLKIDCIMLNVDRVCEDGI